MHLTIREAASGDATDVADVLRLAFAPLRSIYQPTREATAAQSAAAGKGVRIVATFEPQIVGTLEIDVHEDHIHMIGLAVHPRFQRRGIARQIVDSIVARADRLRHSRITLNTIRETGNVPVFQGMGFHVTSEEVATWCESHRHAVLHDIGMERLLA